VGRLKNKGAKRFFVRREGFGHSHGYFVSFLSQNISFARILQILYTFRILLQNAQGLAKAPSFRFLTPLGLAASRTSSALGSNPSVCYKIKSPSVPHWVHLFLCAGEDSNFRRPKVSRFTVCPR
jgi:hypothetical protein